MTADLARGRTEGRIKETDLYENIEKKIQEAINKCEYYVYNVVSNMHTTEILEKDGFITEGNEDETINIYWRS